MSYKTAYEQSLNIRYNGDVKNIHDGSKMFYYIRLQKCYRNIEIENKISGRINSNKKIG